MEFKNEIENKIRIKKMEKAWALGSEFINWAGRSNDPQARA